MEIPDGTSVEAFIRLLKERDLLGSYGPQGVFAVIGKSVLRGDYVLQEGQTVKVLLQPQGG